MGTIYIELYWDEKDDEDKENMKTDLDRILSANGFNVESLEFTED